MSGNGTDIKRSSRIKSLTEAASKSVRHIQPNAQKAPKGPLTDLPAAQAGNMMHPTANTSLAQPPTKVKGNNTTSTPNKGSSLLQSGKNTVTNIANTLMGNKANTSNPVSGDATSPIASLLDVSLINDNTSGLIGLLWEWGAPVVAMGMVEIMKMTMKILTIV